MTLVFKDKYSVKYIRYRYIISDKKIKYINLGNDNEKYVSIYLTAQNRLTPGKASKYSIKRIDQNNATLLTRECISIDELTLTNSFVY